MPFDGTCEQCGVVLTRRADTGRFPRFCSEACRGTLERRDIPERFWASVATAGPNECWPWVGNRNRAGYGRMGIGQALILAPRVSFFLAHGRLPEPHCLHTCDNPSCVNPAHLYEGTPADNVADAVKRGRKTDPPVHRGERAYTAKLTPDHVRDIRVAFANGVRQRDLAKHHGVDRHTIQRVVARKTWQHVK